MVLPIYRAVAESSALLLIVATLQVVSVVVMNQKTSYLMDKFGGNEPPDMWFGIQSKRMYDYLAGIGVEGRFAYLDVVKWDMVPTIPIYSTLLGSLLYKECKKAGISPKLSLIILLATIGDIIETLGCGYATKTFLKIPLTKNEMTAVSYGNQVKWISLGAGIAMLAVLFLKNIFLPVEYGKRVLANGAIKFKEEPKGTSASESGGEESLSSKKEEVKKEK
ncbi:unnamed protein product [Cylindrotheca closterium]|uniref:Uncharacterized protein n=1 Tax=Cylindrotheca closterium TaxID=2856 RepID=A0AAD2CFL3_9STRA|nr:unnamed protein product [Cylindrotheca closterium]